MAVSLQPQITAKPSRYEWTASGEEQPRPIPENRVLPLTWVSHK